MLYIVKKEEKEDTYFFDFKDRGTSVFNLPSTQNLFKNFARIRWDIQLKAYYCDKCASLLSLRYILIIARLMLAGLLDGDYEMKCCKCSCSY